MSKKKVQRDGEKHFASKYAQIRVAKATPVSRDVVDSQLGTNRDNKMQASRARIDERRGDK